MSTICYKVYGPNAPQSGFNALAPLWNDLLQKSRFNSFFLTHEWQSIWWHNLGVGDLWIVAFTDSEGNDRESESLVGIAPLYCYTATRGPHAGQNVLTLVGCTEVSDYLDLIIAQGWEDAVLQSFRNWLYSNEAPNWQRLDLCNLPEDSLTYQRIPEILAEDTVSNAMAVNVSQEDVAPYFPLPATYEDYLQTLVSKKHRHEIRRKQRRIERESTCEFYIFGQDELAAGPSHRGEIAERESFCAEFEPAMDEFLRLQMASRDDKAEFMTDEMAQFFRTMACFMQQAGYLRLCFLRLDGVNAATLMAFEYDGRFWLYNSGYDPDIFASLSPGWAILAYTIQYTIAAGLKVYDFMQGDEEYKYRFGGQDYKVMRVIVER